MARPAIVRGSHHLPNPQISAACLRDNARQIQVLADDGTLLPSYRLPVHADTLLRGPNGRLCIVADGKLSALCIGNNRVHTDPLGRVPRAVRAIEHIGGGRCVLVSDGLRTSDGLRGAEVLLADIHSGCVRHSDHIGPRDNPQFIETGTLDGDPAVLVGVRTRAVFDDRVRLRPWIFAVDGVALRPVWLGTSFSRPFVAAVFCDCANGEGQEICALELTRERRRQIIAYRKRGLVVEGVARSDIGPFGSQLRAIPQSSQEAEMLCVWTGGATGRIVGMRAVKAPAHELAELKPIAGTDLMRRPLAWDVGWMAAQPTVFVLDTKRGFHPHPLKRYNDLDER
ncbi:MAG: hypothetical protein ACLFWB_12455 [Armatimonadota bacterium]